MDDECAVLVSCTFVAAAVVAGGTLWASGGDLADVERWTFRRARWQWWCVRAASVVLVLGALQHGRGVMSAAFARAMPK